MTVPDSVRQLVQRFDEHLGEYQSSRYNETQLRREFLDPFFEALGWDVFNQQGYAEAYKDVIHEDAVKVGGATKAPDYGFRIGGTRKFFVEAKKPAENIKEDVSPAYQLRRYAWSAGLPLSILSDFEEFAVYDCRSKPDKNDKASTGRVMYLGFRDYIDHWDEIAAIFSRQALLKGSFDQYAEAAKGKHGTAEVDDVFLAEIERWRGLLAHNLALRNPGLAMRELNYAVQMTIDRIIFLRICEDRGIEFYGQLQALVNGSEVYPRLCEVFRKADDRYNSGLFHFRAEKGQADAADALTPSLLIDDKPLKDILANLYYPDSPYEFSVLPTEILGQVYEQFLGKVIRLTAGHRAVVEDKPEVKKAGGVFYTPAYIVAYIVRQTVGQLLEGKVPGDRGVGKGEPLRILDPACGSGSFLLGAYQYLLDWYRDGYTAGGAERWSKSRQPALYQSGTGEWKLTTAERKRILLEHIYGVDIDAQAVEVTKLSLLLKVLEGESEQTLATQMSLWQERALPDLAQNIQCGNSLIGTDFYQGTQMSLLGDEEQQRINPFDWQREFAEVFRPSPGGFDVVIGNPPYIRIQALKEWAPLEVEFYKEHYQAASKGNYDIYVVFVEKGVGLLNPQGRLGLILPHKFFNAQYGEPLREFLAKGKYLAKVVHFGDQQVFENATTYTCLMFLDKKGCDSVEVEKVTNLDAWRENRPHRSSETCEVSQSGTIPASSVTPREWNFTVGKGAGLFEKLSHMPVKLGDVAHIFVGTQTSADHIYVLEECKQEDMLLIGKSKSLDEIVIVEYGCTVPFLRGKDIRKYKSIETDVFLICPYEINQYNFRLLSLEEMSKKFPLTMRYFEKNKKELVSREKGKFKGLNWYAFGYPKSMTLFQKPKIITPDYNNSASFTIDNKGYFYKTGYGILLEQSLLSSLYVLGLMNSKLLFHHLASISTSLQGGYIRFWTQYIQQLPIHPINFSDSADVKYHDSIVSLVERILKLHQQLTAARTPNEKTMLQRQIDATDREIDRLVYELYGLTKEEIGVVEGIK